VDKVNGHYRHFLSAAILVSLSVSTFFMFPSFFTAHASSSSAPLLGGWGGTRLEDTVQNSTAPPSQVFPREGRSNFEQIAIRQLQLGYNTIRGSFAPTCSDQYRLNTYAHPQDFMGNYSQAQLTRAVNIAQHFHMWIVVDYHGYADFYNSTLVNCWVNVWNGIVSQFKNSYSRIIWEPLNEPNDVAGGTGNDTVQTAAISVDYQNFINQARSLGDTHWIVVQNLCSFSCGKYVEQYYMDYPTVNDTIGHVFESLHTYLYYNDTAFHTDCHGSCSVWSNSTADLTARAYYLDMLNETAKMGWTNFNTEGGTSCGSGCPHVISGSAGYSIVSFHFIQSLINYEDSASPRIGRLLWVAASWTDTPNAGVYGALNPSQWGTLITYKSFNHSQHCRGFELHRLRHWRPSNQCPLRHVP
jgi:hypothetical protein